MSLLKKPVVLSNKEIVLWSVLMLAIVWLLNQSIGLHVWFVYSIGDKVVHEDFVKD